VPIRINDSQHIRLLIAICLLLFFVDLGGRDIWDIDEGMHAAMAQTMILSGDWITPVFNGEAFFDKPPLFNWLTALSFLIFGVNEFAARLPAALAGLGTVLLTYTMARRAYGARTAIFAGIVMATSLEIILLSRVVQYDIPFTFFTTLALYFCTAAVIDESRRRFHIIGFFAAAALATLVKGPIGVIVPGIAFVGFLVYAKNYQTLRRLFMPSGLLVFAVIAAPWFALMEQANPGYLDYFIVKQHFGNFLGGSAALQPRHPEPFYYYVPVLIGGLLPWSLMLPQSALMAAKTDRTLANGTPVLFLIWVAVIFFFFSIATSKLSTYLLPVFPAAAILIGRYCETSVMAPRPLPRSGVKYILGSTAALLLLFAVYAAVADPWTYWKFRTGIDWWKFEVFVFGITALVGLAFWLERSGRLVAQFRVLSLVSPLLVFYILWVIVPGVDPYKGARDIGHALDARLPPGEKFRFYGQLLDSAIFYADRSGMMLQSEQELNRYLASDERVFVLVRERARRAEDAFPGDYRIIEVIGNKAIVSNQPDPAR
jgi:4-amino-4-deoxy-L-arabinose transferase-like glycosyltransferase